MMLNSKLYVEMLGSGKSAICKKVLMEEEMVNFARAEKIASCDSINNIWNLDVVEALKYLGEKGCYLFRCLRIYL